jgi:ABC-type transport system substrate-binding protein
MKLQNTKSVFIVDTLKRIGRFLFLVSSNFISRIRACLAAMNILEQLLALILFLAAMTMLGMKINTYYRDQTKLVPDFGGYYKEANVGELKYINPVLANNDVDTSISRLIFSPLVEIDKDGNVLPKIAKSWEISPNQLTYTFTLRNDIYFHDGVVLSPEDVVYTVNQIQDPEFQSPLYDAWKDVLVESDGANKVTFTLPKIYGPFIYYCDFGILPSHISPDELSKKFIGTGPYKYVSVKKTNQKVDDLKLLAYDKYHNGKPFITNLEIGFYTKAGDATKAFDNKKVNALTGTNANLDDSIDLSFATSKQIALISNLRIDKFKDKEFRKNIFSDYIFPEKIKVALTTLDAPYQRAKAEELKNNFITRNIELELRYMNPSQMKQILDEKKYELLLYGFDFSHDPDPYVFWHTSQMDKLNFSGFSDKRSDKLLEEARMTTDNKIRREKYDQFFKTVTDESLALFFDPKECNFYVQKEIKGVSERKFSEVSFRYFDIEKWFIKEKRVKK